jgi:hypothetical protein
VAVAPAKASEKRAMRTVLSSGYAPSVGGLMEREDRPREGICLFFQ